jgi:hypothetical protein
MREGWGAGGLWPYGGGILKFSRVLGGIIKGLGDLKERKSAIQSGEEGCEGEIVLVLIEFV